jgi:hypothetical protein
MAFWAGSWTAADPPKIEAKMKTTVIMRIMGYSFRGISPLYPERSKRGAIAERSDFKGEHGATLRIRASGPA